MISFFINCHCIFSSITKWSFTFSTTKMKRNKKKTLFVILFYKNYFSFYTSSCCIYTHKKTNVTFTQATVYKSKRNKLHFYLFFFSKQQRIEKKKNFFFFRSFIKFIFMSIEVHKFIFDKMAWLYWKDYKCIACLP